MFTDPLWGAVQRVAEYGGGRGLVVTIPESASIRLSDGGGHLLAGATITSWQPVAGSGGR